jgi:hypothetical protein
VPVGGRNAFSSSLLSEGGLDWACTFAGTLTARLSVKATANAANIMKRDECVNQPMIKVFSGRAGSFYKDGRTEA